VDNEVLGKAVPKAKRTAFRKEFVDPETFNLNVRDAEKKCGNLRRRKVLELHELPVEVT
jgi:hypothetical protein